MKRSLIIVVLAYALLAVISSVGWEEVRGVFVDVPFVKQHAGKKDCVIVDCRKARDYNKEHIPGAVNFGVLIKNEDLEA